MRRPVRLLAATVAAAAAILVPSLPAQSADAPRAGSRLTVLAPVQDYLADRLTSLASGERTTVLVHGSSLAAARGAVAATGMTTMTSFDKIGVVVARGTRAQVTAARVQPGRHLPRGQHPDRVQPRHLAPGHPGRGGDQHPDRGRRDRPDGQGRVRRGHRLGRGPDAPVPPGPGRDLGRGQQPQGGLRLHRVAVPGARPADDGRHRHALRRWPRHARGRHRRRPADHPPRRPGAAWGGTRLPARVPLHRRGALHHRCRRGPQLGAGEPRGAVRCGRPCGAVPADQGHQQLLRPVRRWRVRPELRDREAPAGARGRGGAHRVGQRQRRGRRIGEPVQPAGHWTRPVA